MRFVALSVLVACSGGGHAREPESPSPIVRADAPPARDAAPDAAVDATIDATIDATPDAPPPTAAAMAHIDRTRFRMGSTSGHPDERPIHRVTVEAFSIDLTEVTVAAYADCVAAKQCTLPDLQVHECDWNRPGLENYPINCVNWDQAAAYCAFAGKRLPTEEEWELAARGTDGRIYPFGNGAAGGEECEFKTADPPLCPVASAPAGRSPFGVFDMTGNVDEWTASAYCPYARPGCGDPRRTTRGGASDFIGGTATSRTGIAPHTIGDALGFRCARSD